MPLNLRMDKEDVEQLHNGVLHSKGKNDIILNFAGKWMDLENIILSDIIQTQKDKYHMYSFIGSFR